MYWRVGLCLMLGGGGGVEGWGLVSRGDGMCWQRLGGLLVGGDVSVGLGLRGGGVRGVGDGGDAVCQGS